MFGSRYKCDVKTACLPLSHTIIDLMGIEFIRINQTVIILVNYIELVGLILILHHTPFSFSFAYPLLTELFELCRANGLVLVEVNLAELRHIAVHLHTAVLRCQACTRYQAKTNKSNDGDFSVHHDSLLRFRSSIEYYFIGMLVSDYVMLCKAECVNLK